MSKSKGVLSFEGNGHVKVQDIGALIRSESFQRQVEAVREISESMALVDRLRELAYESTIIGGAEVEVDLVTRAADRIGELEKMLAVQRLERENAALRAFFKEAMAIHGIDSASEETIALVESVKEAAGALDALAQISRMKVFPDAAINQTTLAAAIALARMAIGGAQK